MKNKTIKTKIINNTEYHWWTDVEEPIVDGLSIRDCVSNYLKSRFPNYRIIGQYFEFNKIDLYVVEEKHCNFNDYIYTPAIYLEIFETEGRHGKNNRLKFTDSPDIAKYFPAYIRNKEKWGKIKGQWLTPKQIENIIEGKVNYDWWKDASNDNGNDLDNNIKIDKYKIDKGINIEIKSNDKIININIKDNTKQKIIDDSWS